MSVDGQSVVTESKLGLTLRDGTECGRNVELVKARTSSTDSTWENPWGKRRRVRDQHNELRLMLRERSGDKRRFEVIFRAFNDGVAFRYVLPAQAGMETFVVEQEQTEFAFAGNPACFAGEHDQGSLVARTGIEPVFRFHK